MAYRKNFILSSYGLNFKIFVNILTYFPQQIKINLWVHKKLVGIVFIYVSYDEFLLRKYKSAGRSVRRNEAISWMDQKKEHIIEIGKELFIEKGYRNTSMQDIAEACNISKATLYKIFQSKEDFSLMVICYMVEQMLCKDVYKRQII